MVGPKGLTGSCLGPTATLPFLTLPHARAHTHTHTHTCERMHTHTHPLKYIPLRNAPLASGCFHPPTTGLGRARSHLPQGLCAVPSVWGQSVCTRCPDPCRGSFSAPHTLLPSAHMFPPCEHSAHVVISAALRDAQPVCASVSPRAGPTPASQGDLNRRCTGPGRSPPPAPSLYGTERPRRPGSTAPRYPRHSRGTSVALLSTSRDLTLSQFLLGPLLGPRIPGRSCVTRTASPTSLRGSVGPASQVTARPLGHFHTLLSTESPDFGKKRELTLPQMLPLAAATPMNLHPPSPGQIWDHSAAWQPHQLGRRNSPARQEPWGNAANRRSRK